MNFDQSLQQAIAHHQAGRLAEAERIYREILARDPNHPDALHLLGVLAGQANQHAAGVELIRRALARQPHFPEAHNNLGKILADSGKTDEAIAHYQLAISQRPNFAEAYSNLGNAFAAKEKFDEAIGLFQRALSINPNFAPAMNNLANALGKAARFEEAIDLYQRAFALRPDYAEAHSNLANVLRELGRFDDAVASYNRALRLQPNLAQTHDSLGNALRDQGKLDEAIASYQRSLELNPNSPETHNNLANALKDSGRLDEAIESYRRALAFRPDNHHVHSNLIYTLHFHPAYSAERLAEEERRWNAQHGEPLKKLIQPHANDRDPDRRLKVGYVSPDFFSQAEAYFAVPLLEAHDHEKFEIHCYSSVRRPDDLTERMKKNADVWHDVLPLSDQQLAEKIRGDGIDILIDLTMHMSGSRLPLFARKPAPVQVTWLAYPGSTGLDTIDYRLTDAHMDPPGANDAFYSEQSVRLPDCWCCYDPLGEIVEVRELPALSGDSTELVEVKPFAFGSLNNFCKVNDAVLKLWAKAMRAIENSRLIMLAGVGSHRQRTIDRLRDEGIAAERVRFVSRLSRVEYLEMYNQIDLGLDTFPYNGITTTCDALWMGVPVLTLPGTIAASRAGLALMSTAGLGNLVPQSEDALIELARSLANDLPRLAELRMRLRKQVEASPLMDRTRFARNVESAYRQMWRTWCGGR